MATSRAPSGTMVGSSRGEREAPVGPYRRLGTPTANEAPDAEFEREINAWAEANVDASEREDSGLECLQREFAREVLKCAAKPRNRKGAGADQIVIELVNYGGEECLP